MQNTSSQISRLVSIMNRLRDKENGCPWDLEQDFKSLTPCVIEEAYEVVDAVEQNDIENLIEELGDLLLQVVFYSQIAAEEGRFDLEEVAKRISDKLIARHPHIFSKVDASANNAEEVLALWEDIKAKEREGKQHESVVDGIAKSLPAMIRAYKLQKRAARIGFEWRNIESIYSKLDEEIAELKEAAESKDPEAISEEYGDVLFVAVNIGRSLGLDVEKSLRDANAKFERRFRGVEKKMNRDYASGAKEIPDEVFTRYWNEEKEKEKMNKAKATG